MAEIVFTYDIDRNFRIARCANVKAGDYLDWKAAPADAEPDPDHPGFVRAPEIMMVTAGAFDITTPDHPDVITLTAGEMSHGYRFRGPHRITAAQDGSGYTCIMPLDGKWRARELVTAPTDAQAGDFIFDPDQSDMKPARLERNARLPATSPTIRIRP